MRIVRIASTLAFFALTSVGAQAQTQYDVVIRGGTIYDGSGSKPIVGDVALRGDSIVTIGTSISGRGTKEINARGLAVAPGFINMLSWANESLIQDGRSQGDIRQGVTLEVMGEGESMGPLTDSMKTVILSQQGDIKYPVNWTTLGGYLDTLVAKGISTNVASFVGAASLWCTVGPFGDRQTIMAVPPMSGGGAISVPAIGDARNPLAAGLTVISAQPSPASGACGRSR